MRWVIIRDNIQYLVFFTRFIKPLGKRYIFLRGMPVPAFPDNIPGQHIKRREKRGRPMPFIINSLTLGNMRQHRQKGRRSFKRLYLRSPVHAQHYCVVRRVHIQARHIGEFFFKTGIIAKTKLLY
jgi:hypothetical protein